MANSKIVFTFLAVLFAVAVISSEMESTNAETLQFNHVTITVPIIPFIVWNAARPMATRVEGEHAEKQLLLQDLNLIKTSWKLLSNYATRALIREFKKVEKIIGLISEIC
ncbi:hypothetical protein Ocin01_19251 [Orchesella cincta]|uniref:Uncharacterized protein n=1 Tax=Orchesella cincta TaxID=48709 RepID=A0A1D2M3E5_ORCCI|nr:hypothetical protein Ocin01_19251 [Orchesella cincta]